MADSLAKITSMLESAKTLTVDAAAAATQKVTLNPLDVSRLLTSRVDRDVLLGMKSVISLMAHGEDGRPFFADVVKNITSTHYKVKCLVMIYLIAYAEIEPDTALLSINSIQRSLNDPNPAVRSKSIRSLAEVKMLSIAPILALSIKRVIADPSPAVRSAAATSIPSAFEIEGTDRKQLFEFLCKLLGDPDPQVVSASITAFCQIKSTAHFSKKMWGPIHGQYRRFTNILGQMDEWCQISLIDLLVEYARHFLPKPQHGDIMGLDTDSTYLTGYDEDLSLFINLLKPLVYSFSDSVIIAAAKALFCVASPSLIRHFRYNEALIRVATTTKNPLVSSIAYELMSMIHDKDNHVFDSLYKKFYISPLEPTKTLLTKLEILLKLANDENFQYIFEELKQYALHSADQEIAYQAVDAIGFCSQISREWSEIILSWCLQKIRSSHNPLLLSRLLSLMRLLIQQKSHERSNLDSDVEREIHQLLTVLADEGISLEGNAKASMIWIIGELGISSAENVAVEALKIVLRRFAQEPDSVRYQALMLAAKIYTHEVSRLKSLEDREELANIEEKQISKLFKHTLHLAKYDTSFDTRDRARMMDVLLNRGTEEIELASLFLQAHKPVPQLQSRSKQASEAYETTMLKAYLTVPDWASPDHLPHAEIRQATPIVDSRRSATGISSNTTNSIHRSSPPTVKAPMSGHGSKITEAPAPYKLQSLDEFFGEETLEEESEEDDSEEDDSEEEESDGEESEEEDSEYDVESSDEGIDQDDTQLKVVQESIGLDDEESDEAEDQI